VIYSNNLLHQVRKELEVFPKIYGRFAEVSTKDNIESELLEIILTEVIQKINFPIIVTDVQNNPKYWKNIESNASDQEINPEKLKEIAFEMEKNETFILIKEPQTGEMISKIMYSSSHTIKRLKFLPYVEFFIVILFIAVGISGLSMRKKQERNLCGWLWQKETAHQFGTPITSLLGWLEVLQIQKVEGYKDTQQIDDIVQNMKEDVCHLEKIASRFGKVGSDIQIKQANIEATIYEALDYFRERIPRSNNQINLNYINHAEDKVICFDPDLIKWALENLIKNAIDALKDKSGNIFIITYDKGNKFYIQVKDEGCGIPKKAQKLIFDTGFTTKNRGWGLGLALNKKESLKSFITARYMYQKSEPDEGTTIEIMLTKKE